MDVDLSTDLNALLPLVAPLLSGHSDVAIGTRLARGSRVIRGPKRELISRCYNLLLHACMGARFSDAQCGFKAIRRDQARTLLPLIQDTGWFFDTELLVLAERAGLRIHEVPVDWIDDPDSRVDIVATALADLRGMVRLGGGFAAARSRSPSQVRAAGWRRPRTLGELRLQIASFAWARLASRTCCHLLLPVRRRQPGGHRLRFVLYRTGSSAARLTETNERDHVATHPPRPTRPGPAPAARAEPIRAGRARRCSDCSPLTALLYLWDLTRNGWANDFYAAAVQAGTKSWKAFFFGSFDSSNFITVDKTPASLWVMELSGRIFGFSPWSHAGAAGAARAWPRSRLLYAAVRALVRAPGRARRRAGARADAGGGPDVPVQQPGRAAGAADDRGGVRAGPRDRERADAVAGVLPGSCWASRS